MFRFVSFHWARVGRKGGANYFVFLITRIILSLFSRVFNPLKPNGAYRRRTEPLTSKVAFYIFIQ